jgi:hypothetical protein
LATQLFSRFGREQWFVCFHRESESTTIHPKLASQLSWSKTALKRCHKLLAETQRKLVTIYCFGKDLSAFNG